MVKDPTLATLSFAARPRVVAKHLGQLMLVVSGSTLVPLAVAVYDGERDMALRLAASALALTILGGTAARSDSAPRMQANEALAVAALSYIVTAVAMVLPFMAHGLSATDALFESASAVTTTGLSTIAHVEAMPRSFLFLRAWMQWYGGLGIVVLSVALLVGDDAIARRLVGADPAENLVTTTRLYARRMLAVYVALTAIGFGAVALSGVPPFEAVCHVLAAISTGGFSTHDRSLGTMGSAFQRGEIMAVCVLGAISLPLYLRLYSRNWKALLHNDEVRALGAAIVLATALIFIFEADRRHADADALGNALLLAVSAQTTTGFATFPPADLTAPSKFVVILAMKPL